MDQVVILSAPLGGGVQIYPYHKSYAYLMTLVDHTPIFLNYSNAYFNLNRGNSHGVILLHPPAGPVFKTGLQSV